MNLSEEQKAFVKHLLSLARMGQEDICALADLRSGLGKPPSEMMRVKKHVVPFLSGTPSSENWYYILASLFGMFTQHRKGYSFGMVFQLLRFKGNSIDTRFVSLINANSENLGKHLRHAVSLLKTNEQPFDWFMLFQHLLQWDHPDHHVQLSWARDFYGVPILKNCTSATSITSKQNEESHE